MNILLAIDASGASRRAVAGVAARPWPEGTSIEVVHVGEPPHLWLTSETARELSRLASVAIQESVKQLREAGLAARGSLLEGDPKRVIPERAAKSGADLIVVGSHGASGLSRLLLGSTSTAIIRHAPCPVEVSRGRRHPDAGWKILLATDGSACSELAARAIAGRRWPAGSEVRILAAVEFVAPMGLIEPPGIDFAENEEYRAQAMLHAQQAIEAAAAIVSPSCPKVSQSISVLAERPRKIILDEAERWDPDIIFLGSHGRGAVDRVLLGSVSEAVATYAHCSVEIVRGKLA